jgi:hypothetical protein
MGEKTQAYLGIQDGDKRVSRYPSVYRMRERNASMKKAIRIHATAEIPG